MAKKVESIWKEQAVSSDIKHQPVSEKFEIIGYSGRHIEQFVKQNSPVNNEIARNAELNDLYKESIFTGDSAELTEVTVRKGHGRMSPVYTFCSFTYDESVDLERLNKNGRYKITGYDRRVYDAIGTLWLDGKKRMSLTEIFEVMNGYSRAKPSTKQLQSLEKSLNKMRSILVYIDLSQEVKSNMIPNKEVLVAAGLIKNLSDNIKSVVIDENMLQFRMETVTSEQGKVIKHIKLKDEPCLLTYNRAKGTLISIPMEYIGLQDSNATEKSIAFQDYILMRIISYKNGKLSSDTILYDTLYRDSGIERPSVPKDLKRDRDVVKKIMEELQRKGLIISFAENQEGRSFVGITFRTDRKTIGPK